MDISGRVNGVLRSFALWAGLGVAILAIALGGVGFLIAGFYIFLADRMGNAAAAASTGGVLLVMAIFVALIGGAIIKKTKKQRPSLLSEFGGTIGMAGRLVGMLVRRDPKKALIISIIAGALAEYVTSEKKG
jgi:hypothetical protein